MNKEESKYFMTGIMQESVYRNHPNQNAVKEKIKEIKEIMEKEYGIPSATVPQTIFHAVTYYINQHKKNEETK